MQLPQAEPWEYQFLSQSVAQTQLSVVQGQGVIKASLEEVLFSWVSNPTLTSDWSTAQKFSLRDNSALSLLLSSPQVERVLHQSQQLWKDWKDLELGAVNPHMAPVLRQTSLGDSSAVPPIPANLSPYLNGKHTLWDVACYVRRPVTTITRFLLPWVQRGAIALEEISDLPTPVLSRSASSIPIEPYKPLIACVDDSPTVGQVMSSLLTSAGYRVIVIQEPLAGIGILNQHKPDLIFLDLMMPETSGYNLCTFLRGTPAFRNTPIIILTSQDGLLDRTRAKLAGATDFLPKPPDPKVMLSMIRGYIRSGVQSNLD